MEVETNGDVKPDAGMSVQSTTMTGLNSQEEFNVVLDNAILKLWDERSRNKSKGKRKRLSKDEEKTLSMCTADCKSVNCIVPKNACFGCLHQTNFTRTKERLSIVHINTSSVSLLIIPFVYLWNYKRVSYLKQINKCDNPTRPTLVCLCNFALRLIGDKILFNSKLHVKKMFELEVVKTSANDTNIYKICKLCTVIFFLIFSEKLCNYTNSKTPCLLCNWVIFQTM